MRDTRAALMLLIIAALAAMPVITGGTYYAFLGIIVFIYSIVAIGLNILSGYAGQFSLGHAAFMAMGAYTTALLTKALATISFFAQTGLHILLGVICGTIVAALSGIVLAVPALRVRGPYLAMVTIAFGWSSLENSAGMGFCHRRRSWGSPRYRNRRSACCGSRRGHSTTSFSPCFLALALQVRLVSSQFGTRMRWSNIAK
jgi:ABC-type branched-subunit amino acid transport system permease subunit